MTPEEIDALWQRLAEALQALDDADENPSLEGWYVSGLSGQVAWEEGRWIVGVLR